MAKINGQDIDDKALASALLTDGDINRKRAKMIEAERYYEVKNTHIEEKKREFSIGQGRKVENTSVSNVKLPNAFYRKAVEQKVNYAFGKPPVISIEPIDPDYKNENEEKLYQLEWDKLLNPENRMAIQNLAHFAVNCGIGYVYIYMDDEGFHLVNTPSPEIRPYWSDKTHTKLEALLRDYKAKVYNVDNLQGFSWIGKAELWTDESVTFFENKTGLDLLGTEKHMAIGNNVDDKNEEVEGVSWGKVPFLWLKGTRDELSLLELVKRYIDAYDDLNSQSVDTLKDDLDCAVIFKNYDSNVGKLIDAVRTLKETKAGAVDGDGGISLLKNNPDISAIQTKLEHIKKDITEFTYSVNVQDIKFGSNPSGVAIKSAFQDIDTYVNGLEMQFELFIQLLKYFFDKYLDWTGRVPLEVSAKYKVVATLDRDMMINESELIDNVGKLQGLVSQETLDDYNPAVENHAQEQARRDAEAEKEADSQFNFPDELPEPEIEVEPERETITKTQTERIKE